MKSFLIIFFLYLALFFYGGTKSTNKNLANAKRIYQFSQNKFSQFDDQGKKIAEVQAKEVKTSDFKSIELFDTIVHAFINNRNDKNHSLNLNEDIFLEAQAATIYVDEKLIHINKNLELTYGTHSYLEAEKAIWDQKKETIILPSSFTFQKDNNLFQGESGLLFLQSKNITIEKNLSASVQVASHLHKDIDQKHLMIESQGPLTFNDKNKKITINSEVNFYNQTTQITCGKALLFLDENNQLTKIVASENVNVNISDKKVNAQSPSAEINLIEETYTFRKNDIQRPQVKIQNFEQSADIITFDHKTGVLKAGPKVYSKTNNVD